MIEQNFTSLIRDGTPARLDSERAAKLLGFGGHDVPVLIAAGMLRPLGNPPLNAPKHFALVELLALAEDRDWLHKATRAVSRHWQRKNDEQRNKRATQIRRPVPSVTGDGLDDAQSVSAKVPATRP
jgi:hypothetical protein